MIQDNEFDIASLPLLCLCPAFGGRQAAGRRQAGSRQAAGRECFYMRQFVVFQSIKITWTLNERKLDFDEHFVVRNDD